jgi:hypothetical protein
MREIAFQSVFANSWAQHQLSGMYGALNSQFLLAKAAEGMIQQT